MTPPLRLVIGALPKVSEPSRGCGCPACANTGLWPLYRPLAIPGEDWWIVCLENGQACQKCGRKK